MGPTALGPAALCAVALAKANGTIILCTDGMMSDSNGKDAFLSHKFSGLANVGLGAMDTLQTAAEQEAVESFYRRVADYAKSNGIVINTISIEGEDCKLENLGILADTTSGQVSSSLRLVTRSSDLGCIITG